MARATVPVSASIFANTDAGVALKDGARHNTIGGTTAATRNIIAGSTDGVLIEKSSGNKVTGNYIGTGPDGTESGFGNGTGVHLGQNATDNVIGGAAATARNVISGNTSDGVTLDDGADSNTIAGNYIGTEFAASFALPNDGNGISIDGAQNTVMNNLISGNTMAGVAIDSGSSNTITGNFIGTDLEGASALANGSDGVSIGGAQNTVSKNVISGNGGDGVSIDGGQGNTILSNHIGTDLDGAAALANTTNGVSINGAQNTVRSNFISGNLGDGVAIDGGTANTIQGNSIGVDATGAGALKNNMNGVTIKGGQTSVLKNVISGNTGDGISIEAGNGDTILGNDIGTDSKGKAAVPNGGDGLHAKNSVANIFGGLLAAQRNVIGGNTGDGIHLELASSATIQGNSIGADATGKLSLGNGGDGIHMEGSSSNTVGGSKKGEGNIINYNIGDGIHIESMGNMNTIKGNLIGTDAAAKKDRGNMGEGIHIDKSDDNTIGGIATGEGNTIAFNKKNGILFDAGKNNVI